MLNYKFLSLPPDTLSLSLSGHGNADLVIARNQLSGSTDLATSVEQIAALTRQDGGFVLIEEVVQSSLLSVVLNAFAKGDSVVVKHTKDELVKAINASGLQVNISLSLSYYHYK